MRDQVKRFAGVLEGREKVVHVPKHKDARAFREKYDVKFKSVVIPAPKTATARYNKRQKVISVWRTENGKRTRTDLSTRRFEKISDLPVGPDIGYRIHFAGGQVFTWSGDGAREEMAAFMSQYSDPAHVAPRTPWVNWLDYVEIVEVDISTGEIVDG